MRIRGKEVEPARIATYIFWFCLAVSIAVNGTVGWLEPGEVPPAVAVGVHVTYPVFLALAETLLVHVPSTGVKWVDFVRYVGGFLIAATALAGSAKTLHHLSVLAGNHPYVAVSLPAVVDVLMVIAMLTAVTMARTERASKPAATRPAAKAVNPTVGRPAIAQASKKQRANDGLSDEVAAAVREDPALTLKALADRFGVSTKTIGRTAGWKNRKSLEAVAV